MFETTSGQSRKTAKPSSGRVTCIVLGAPLLILVALGISVIIDRYAFGQVVLREDAGRIVDASFSSGFGGRTTAIKTELGTFMLEGVLPATHGHRVRIEKRGNGDKALCDADTGECRRMIER